MLDGLALLPVASGVLRTLVAAPAHPHSPTLSVASSDPLLCSHGLLRLVRLARLSAACLCCVGTALAIESAGEIRLCLSFTSAQPGGSLPEYIHACISREALSLPAYMHVYISREALSLRRPRRRPNVRALTDLVSQIAPAGGLTCWPSQADSPLTCSAAYFVTWSVRSPYLLGQSGGSLMAVRWPPPATSSATSAGVAI